MKKLQNVFAAFALVTVFALGTSMANAGIIINSFGEDDPCTASDGTFAADKDGIIINSLTGIIINSLTGIIINSAAEVPSDCGIIINS